MGEKVPFKVPPRAGEHRRLAVGSQATEPGAQHERQSGRRKSVVKIHVFQRTIARALILRRQCVIPGIARLSVRAKGVVHHEKPCEIALRRPEETELEIRNRDDVGSGFGEDLV